MPDQNNVIKADFSRNGWGSGQARCVGCRHEWVAVAPIGATEFECPACSALKGFFIGTYSPEERWECACECDLFYMTRTGAMCINCGVRQEF